MNKLKVLACVFSFGFILFVSTISVRAELIYGMVTASSASTAAGTALVKFDSATPGTITNIGNFTGIVAGQAVRSIDFRPATGVLYAISTDGAAAAQLYTVNLTTAALTTVGSGFTLATNASARVEMDFNPVADRIRVVIGGTTPSPTSFNFRVNPNDGTLVATDTSLAWAAGDPNTGVPISVVGCAYSNNVAGATTTTLYAWDYNTDSLATIGSIGGTPNSPNSGIMNSIDQPVNALTGNAGLGMDISGVTGILYVTHDDPVTATSMNFYTRNLTTGAETLVGAYPAGTFISDISVKTPDTAAGVTVSGRLLNAEGRGIFNGRVTLTDQSGVVRTAFSLKGGRFQFDDVEVGSTYIFTASSRQYQFENATRVISLTDAISDLDFVGSLKGER